MRTLSYLYKWNFHGLLTLLNVYHDQVSALFFRLLVIADSSLIHEHLTCESGSLWRSAALSLTWEFDHWRVWAGCLDSWLPAFRMKCKFWAYITILEFKWKYIKKIVVVKRVAGFLTVKINQLYNNVLFEWMLTCVPAWWWAAVLQVPSKNF